jgi:hypothetical protein
MTRGKHKAVGVVVAALKPPSPYRLPAWPPLRAPLNLSQILGHSLSIDRLEPVGLLRLFD